MTKSAEFADRAALCGYCRCIVLSASTEEAIHAA